MDTPTEMNLWLLSVDTSLSFLLGLGTSVNLVRLNYQPKHKFNDLTLVPYYIVIAFSVAGIAQYTLIATKDGKSKLFENTLLLINVIKINLGYTVFATAIYEWFCILKMINFQKNYTLTTVGAARDKFRPIEKRHFLIFKTVLALFYLSSLTIIVLTMFPKRFSSMNEN